jgi:hypothetical protein
MEASTSTSPPPRVFPKKRIRIPGIEDLDLPSASSDAQPPKKKTKKPSPSPGIVYISRLPPGMTHQKVKHILTGYGDIGKIYAQQKDGKSSHKEFSKSLDTDYNLFARQLLYPLQITSHANVNTFQPTIRKHGSNSRTRRLQK